MRASPEEAAAAEEEDREPGGEASGPRAARCGLRAPSSSSSAAVAAPGVARGPAMSASCLAGPLSAPSELDSACRMERPGSAAPAPPAGRETGGPAALLPAAAAASPSVGGELELALEEELALLASAGEGPGEAEAQGPAAATPAEPELLSLMRQKEKDLVLAARLGKALLERNQDLSRQYERMYKELTEKLEVRPARLAGRGGDSGLGRWGGLAGLPLVRSPRGGAGGVPL